MAGALVRVAVHSTQEIVREGITALLDKHPDKVTVVGLPTEPGHPERDVVLYDAMALLDGDTEHLRHLVDLTASKVLAVGRDLRPDLVGQALAVGVDGFFSIGVDEKELLGAVESAVTGWVAGDPGPDPTIGASTSDARASQVGADVGLTEREAEVLALVAKGLSNQEIAARLYLSPNSIKTYIRTSYRKIGAENRAGAVGWAIRHGFTSER